MSIAWHAIRDHLTDSSSKLNFQRSYDAIRRTQAALAPFRDPAALLDGLHRTPGNQDQKNLILAALVEAAQGDGPTSDCSLTLLLLALWPGLDVIRRRSLWRRLGSADEIASDVLARTTEAVRGLDLGRVNWIAATVLRNVERDMIRVRQRDQAREHLASGPDPDEVADSGESGIGAAGYELLTGDLSQVNYSSIRAGLVEFRRMIDAVQWQLFIPMLCAPVWRWFTEAAWAAGQIPTPDVPVEWSPPKFDAVDPYKDAMADLLAIRTGTMTLAQAIARQGHNPDAVLAEIAATNAKLDGLGLVLDSARAHGAARPRDAA